MASTARNLVVCCDGTNNEIGKLLSNVLKTYRVAEKSDNQVTFYQPGIGTIAMPDSWGRWRQWLRGAFEMGTGYGLDRDVLNAYRFLCEEYRDGDRIFLFGFSRGAYTVRVLAGLIYLVGLLRQHQLNFAGYALKAYKSASRSDDYQLAHDFSEVVLPQPVPIHFMGVWDTVASVIVPGRLPFSKLRLEELPFTTDNPAIKVFRQASAVDVDACFAVRPGQMAKPLSRIDLRLVRLRIRTPKKCGLLAATATLVAASPRIRAPYQNFRCSGCSKRPRRRG